ncbi:MAG: acyltransferase [Prevotella sp.]|nr:acyltransferase [Prevotella sp.]
MNEKKRIEYIDSMRGFTMLLVVAHHVAANCLGIGDYVPSIHPILCEFRMPLFFFISGFVLYKEETIWNASHVARFLVFKKFPVQIITTSIFFLVFIKLNHIGLVEGLYTDSKFGYWFTLALFAFFCIYAICRYMLGLFNCKNILADIILLSIGFLLFVLFYVKSVYFKLPIEDEIRNLFSLKFLGYFLYFTIGTLFKKHFNIIQVILDKKYVLTICLVIFFGFNLFYNELVSTHDSLFHLITAFVGIVIVFSFFRIHQDLFKKERNIGKCLQYVGRRTLDIYLLHYLLLPTNLKTYFTSLTECPIPIIEFTITIIVTLIVVMGCLVISRILRMSPVLSYLLFGVKKQKN